MAEKAVLAVVALLASAFMGLPVMAQISPGAVQNGDVSEWSGLAPRVAPAPASGVVADETFALIKQGGPWRQVESSRVGVAEIKLLSLLQQKQWAEAMAWLKQAQPDVNVRDPQTGSTPLTLASLQGQQELVRELIRRGAELDRVGAGGWTALGGAVFQGHELIARDLLRKGARLDAPGATGQLPLHLACATGQTRLIKLLIDGGADLHEFNKQGRHAMAEAALFGQVGAMQTLAAAGARYDEPDRYGLNALHAAAVGEQKDALAFLSAKGVSVPSTLTAILVDQVLNPAPVVQ